MFLISLDLIMQMYSKSVSQQKCVYYHGKLHFLVDNVV